MLLIILHLISPSLQCGIHSCQAGYRLDQGSCSCVAQLRNFCKKSCRIGRWLNNKCECKKNKSCGINLCFSGFEHDNKSCKCKRTEDVDNNCKIKSCHDGFKMNNNCNCIAEKLPTCRMRCQTGYTVYPGKCQCVPRRTCHIKDCKESAMINEFCKCESKQNDEPVCDIDCPEGTHFKDPCQCIIDSPPITDEGDQDNQCQINKCKPGFLIDLDFCECEEKDDPVCEIGCPQGQVVYPGVCSCVDEYECEIESCKGSSIVNDFCECEKKDETICDVECPQDTLLDDNCECIPKEIDPTEDPNDENICEIKKCKKQFNLNKDDCDCEEKIGITCRLGCPMGFKIYPGECKCVPIVQCPILECAETKKLTEDCFCIDSEEYNLSLIHI